MSRRSSWFARVARVLILTLLLELLVPLGVLAQGDVGGSPAPEAQVSPAASAERVKPRDRWKEPAAERRAHFKTPDIAEPPKRMDLKDVPAEIPFLNIVIENGKVVRDASQPPLPDLPEKLRNLESNSAAGELAATEEALEVLGEGAAVEVAQSGGYTPGQFAEWTAWRGGPTPYKDMATDGTGRPVCYQNGAGVGSDCPTLCRKFNIAAPLPDEGPTSITTRMKVVCVSPEASDNAQLTVADGTSYTAYMIYYYQVTNHVARDSGPNGEDVRTYDSKLINYANFPPYEQGQVAYQFTGLAGNVGTQEHITGFAHWRPGHWTVDTYVTDTEGRNETISGGVKDQFIRRNLRLYNARSEGGFWAGTDEMYFPSGAKGITITGQIQGATDFWYPFPPEYAWAPQNPEWTIDIKNQAGTVVRTMTGSTPNTEQTSFPFTKADGSPVTWDGLDNQGQPVPPGRYDFYISLHVAAQHGTSYELGALDGLWNGVFAFTPVLRVEGVQFANPLYWGDDHLGDLFADNGEIAGSVFFMVVGASTTPLWSDGGPYWAPDDPVATVQIVNLAGSTVQSVTGSQPNSEDYVVPMAVGVSFVDGVGQPLPYGSYQVSAQATANGVQSPVNQSQQTRVGSVAGNPAGGGSVELSAVDFVLPARGVNLVVSRSYDSSRAYQEPYFGWSFNFDAQVRENQDGSLTFKHPGGTRDRYTPSGGAFQAVRVGNHTQMSKEVDGSFKAVFKGKAEQRFDSSGRMTRVQDTAGNGVDYFYDGDGRMTRMVDPVGREVLLSYDPTSGRLEEVRYDGDVQASYGYTGEGHLSSVGLPAGTTRYYYNPTHFRLERVRSPRAEAGNWDDVTYEYDQFGRMTKQTDASGLATTTTYLAPAERKTQVQEGQRQPWTYEYDSLDRVTKVTDPLGHFTTTEFADAVNPHKPTRATNARSFSTQFAWDARGNLTSVQDALGRTTLVFWDPDWDKPTRIVGPGPVSPENRFTYHGTTGRLVDWFDPANLSQHYDYDAYGQLTRLTDRNGNPSTFAFDTHGNLTTQNNALGQTTTYRYDGLGLLTRIEHPLAGTWSEAYYDQAHRLTKVVEPYDEPAPGTPYETVAYEYDGNDLLTRLTRKSGGTETREFAYDERGLLTRTTEAANGASPYVTRFYYDTYGNLTKTTDARSRDVNTYTYSALDQLLTVRDVHGQLVQSLSHDANGNVTSRTDGKNQTLSFQYDALDQLTRKTYPDASQVTWAYDTLGRRTAMVDPQGTSTYAYDSRSRLTAQTVVDAGTSASKSLTYGFDDGGRLTQVGLPDGPAITYSYDAADRLTRTSASGKDIDFSYDGNGRLTQRTLTVLNHKMAYSYYANGLLKTLEALVGTDFKQRETYHYFGPGWNLSARTVEQPGSSSDYTYSYDLVDRLTRSTRSDGGGPVDEVLYTYDEVGNRLTLSLPQESASEVGTYNDLNQLTQRVVDEPGGQETETFAYDGNGTLTAQTLVGEGTTTLEHNTDNLVRKITWPDATYHSLQSTLNRAESVTMWPTLGHEWLGWAGGEAAWVG